MARNEYSRRYQRAESHPFVPTTMRLKAIPVRTHSKVSGFLKSHPRIATARY
jgi:hypothetical protein